MVLGAGEHCEVADGFGQSDKVFTTHKGTATPSIEFMHVLEPNQAPSIGRPWRDGKDLAPREKISLTDLRATMKQRIVQMYKRYGWDSLVEGIDQQLERIDLGRISRRYFQRCPSIMERGYYMTIFTVFV